MWNFTFTCGVPAKPFFGGGKLALWSTGQALLGEKKNCRVRAFLAKKNCLSYLFQHLLLFSHRYGILITIVTVILSFLEPSSEPVRNALGTVF